MPEPVRRGCLRLAPPARAIVDAYGWCLSTGNTVRIEGLVREALAQGRVGVSELEGELDRGPRRSSARLRCLLTAAKAEERSTAARRFLEGLGRDGPFGALRNVAIYAGRKKIAVAEAMWPTRAVIAAVGASEEQDRSLTHLGFAVVPIPPRRVAEDLTGVLRNLAAVLVARPEATLPTGVALLPLATDRAVTLGVG